MAGIVEAVSEFASRAAEKLRLQDGVAGAVNVFFTTSPYRLNDRQHSANVTVPLLRPTADSRLLVATAVEAVHRLFRPGINYVKADVMLLDLQPASLRQGELELFDADDAVKPAAAERDRSALMQAMDELNRRFGRGAVQIASASIASGTSEERSWSTKQERRSPRCTTRWDEMPVVRA